jgi:hypothetical protein
MRGFVCVDPRLSKVGGNPEKIKENRKFTEEALEGLIRRDAVGSFPVSGDAAWKAGAKPIVISAARRAELNLGGSVDADGTVRGTSKDSTGTVTMPWALIPYDKCRTNAAYTNACGPKVPNGAYGVFFDHHFAGSKQELPKGLMPSRIDGYQPVLGLTNPGSDDYGYRACVTGDYDLFAVWPPSNEKHDRFQALQGPRVDLRAVDAFKQESGANNPHYQQHYKLGNISPRLNSIKVALNTALIGKGAYAGGNLVHHSDEVGNPSPGLRKTLNESFPLLAFVPSLRNPTKPSGLCALDTNDFRALVWLCQNVGLAPTLRPEWVDLVRR